jgi:hypothetical protein
MRWRIAQKVVEIRRRMTMPAMTEDKSSMILSLSVIRARFIVLRRSSIGSAISVTVEKLVKCLVVGSLGLKGATINGQRELLLGGRSAAVIEVVTTLEEGLNVRIRRGLFHRIIITCWEDFWEKRVPVLELA